MYQVGDAVDGLKVQEEKEERGRQAVQSEIEDEKRKKKERNDP